MKRTALCLLFLGGIFFSVRLHAQTLDVTGSWSLSITEADLQAGTGSDFIDTYESVMGAVLVNVRGASFGKNWYVNIHKQDVSWNPNLHLDIKRNPATYNYLAGGTSYSEITNADREFFRTTQKKNALGIQVQFRLRGVSLQNNPANVTHTTTVVYTLMDI